jgi:hypothetical protein
MTAASKPTRPAWGTRLAHPTWSLIVDHCPRCGFPEAAAGFCPDCEVRDLAAGIPCRWAGNWIKYAIKRRVA